MAWKQGIGTQIIGEKKLIHFVYLVRLNIERTACFTLTVTPLLCRIKVSATEFNRRIGRIEEILTKRIAEIVTNDILHIHELTTILRISSKNPHY